jgi:HK97 family phage prohead protease
MDQVERRYIPLADLGDDGLCVEERDGGAPVIRGIAPPWESLSVDLGGFREKFASTAFDKILSKKRIDVPLLFNHEDSQILARTTNGTLRITKEDRGLAYEADPVPTADSEKVLTLIRTKTIFGSSFAFTVGPKGEKFEEDARGNIIRTITEASGLFDVSAVTRAAYPSSALSARSLSAWKSARAVVAAGEERAASGLTISLDFDQTFTAAPGLWRSFISDATARGSRVVCITRREDTPENREAITTAFGDLSDALGGLVLCGPSAQKRDAAEAAGLSVDIWIDDTPETIPSSGETRAAVTYSTSLGARAAAAAAIARLRNYAG